jgi:hypothetical protein
MTSIYLVEEKGLHNDYSPTVDEIISINPDKIICLCMNEVDAQLIFRTFFDKIKSWLKNNNKIINLVVPHLNNIFIEEGIKAERTYGYILYHLLNNFYSEEILPSVLPPQYMHLHNKNDLLYTCYNRRNEVARAMLVDALVRENLLHYGIVTYHQPTDVTWKYHNGARLMDELDYECNQFAPRYIPSNCPASMMRGFFDIVTESRYGPDEYFITEKTLKSIMLLRPFIAFSSTGYNTEYLAKYIGLELYDEMFDYDFDSCDSLEERIDGIINNVITLKHKIPDSATKHSMYKKLIPKLIRNRNKIVDIFFDKSRIVPDCLQILMSSENYTLHGCTNHHLLMHMRRMGWITE